jgi:hypothetical protein
MGGIVFLRRRRLYTALMSVPTKTTVIGGVVALSVLGFFTVLGEPLLAWLSPPDIAVPSAGAASAPTVPQDGGAAPGRDT